MKTENLTPLPSAGVALNCCPRCGEAFTRKRKDQQYCSRPCQKAATHNAARGSQKIEDNVDTRRLAELHRHRAFQLNDELYRKPPADRPAFVESLLQAARDHDWHLRRILTDSRSLFDFGHDYAGRPNLVRTLDDYCRKTRQARIWQVVEPDWKEPTSIRPLALYRDPWTDPDDSPETSRDQYVRRDPLAFLSHLRALRAGHAMTANAA